MPELRTLSPLLSSQQTTTHNMTSDADYTLIGEENPYGRLVITDTGVVLTAARNIIVGLTQKPLFVQNDTAQILTIKTSSGTGIAIPAGAAGVLYSDGTNVIDLLSSTVYSVSVVSKSATYTATGADTVILCTGTFTLTLPTAVGHSGVKYVKNVSTGTITVDCFGAETIDGGATAELTSQYESISLVSDGGNWYVL